MTSDGFRTLSSERSSPKLALVELTLLDPATGAVVPVSTSGLGAWSNRDYTTRPTDTPAHRLYAPRIRGGYEVRWSRVDGTLLRGRAQADFGSLELINVDRGLNRLATDFLAAGQDAVVRAGSPSLAYAEHQIVLDGLCEEVLPSRDGRFVELVLTSRDRIFAKNLQTDIYRGLGYAVGLRSSSYVGFPHTAAMNPTSAVCLEAFIRLDSLGGTRRVAGHGDVTRGPALRVDATGHVIFSLVDSADAVVSRTSMATLSAGVSYRISGRWDGTKLDVAIDGVIETGGVPFSGTPKSLDGTGALADQFVLGWNSAETLGGWATDVRYFVDTVRSDEEIYAAALRELDDTDTTGLVLYAKTNEAVDATTWDSVSDQVGTFNGAGATWEPTMEGGADLADVPRPTSLGEIGHRDAVLVDAVRYTYQWHSRSSHALDGVFEGGRKLAPVKSDTATDISFDATRQRIVTAGAVDFRQYAPGQNVTVSGAGANDGMKTLVRVDDVAGRWISVLEAVTTVAAGPSVTVATTTDRHDYTFDLATSTFTLRAAATLPITCAVRGDDVGGYVDSAAEILERYAVDFCGWDQGRVGASVAAVAASHPWPAGYATSIEHVEATIVLSRLAISIGHSWGAEPESGDLELVADEAPDPAPPAELDLQLDESSILSIERERTVPAVTRCVASYAPNFRPLQWDELAGAVQEDSSGPGLAWIDFLTNPWRFVPNDTSLIVPPAQSLNQVAVGEDRLETYLRRKPHARLVAQQEFDLYGVDREFFRVRTKLQGLTVAPRRASVLVRHDGWGSTEAGKRFKIVGRTASLYSTLLEVWG